MTAEHHKLLLQYKEVIRNQDEDLQKIKQELHELKAQHNKLLEDFQELTSSSQQLRDQNALLKAQKSTSSLATLSNLENGEYLSSNVIEELKKENEKLRKELSDLKEILSQKVGKS